MQVDAGSSRPAWYAPVMRSYRIELNEDEIVWLREAADMLGRSEEEVILVAVRRYIGASKRPCKLAIDGVGRGPGGSIADIPDEELLKGFGE